MSRIKKSLVSLVAVFAMLLPVAVPAVAQAQIQEGLERGTCLDVNSSTCDVGDGKTQINDIIATVINIFSIVVGLVAVIMIIIGGFKYITSGGDSGNVTGAKNTILYAVIGLVVVALSQVIVRFVLTSATSAL
jgi:hypothetical protein